MGAVSLPRPSLLPRRQSFVHSFSLHLGPARARAHVDELVEQIESERRAEGQRKRSDHPSGA
jgi:hypothetical protein